MGLMNITLEIIINLIYMFKKSYKIVLRNESTREKYIQFIRSSSTWGVVHYAKKLAKDKKKETVIENEWSVYDIVKI